MSLFLLKDPFTHSFWHRDFFGTPLSNEEAFEVNLNVEHFKPEEITIKLTEDNVLVVEGKHEEKKDENGSVARHFVRKCAIPKEYDVGKIRSRFYSDGILTVTAPRIQRDEDGKSRDIPVTRVKGSLKSKL